MQRPTRMAVLVTAALTAGLTVPAAAASGPATRPAPAEQPEDRVFLVARNALMGRYLMGVGLRRKNAEIAYHPETDLWEVIFTVNHHEYGTSPLLRVMVDDRSGQPQIVEETILEHGRPAPSMGEALALVRQSPLIGRWLVEHSGASLTPEYRVFGGGWFIRVHFERRHVGNVWVLNGKIVGSEGPWHLQPGLAKTLYDTRARLRPAFSLKQIAYLMAAIILVLLVDLRRPWTFQTLDALVLASFVPGFLLIRDVAQVGYPLLMGATAYLVGRLVWRAGRPVRASGLVARAPAALVLIIVAALLWQTFNAHLAERSTPEFAGLIEGARLYDTGYWPLGWSEHGRDAYGPFHYLLYGLAARAFPTKVLWNDPDVEERKGDMDLTGSRVLGLVFHLITVAALVALMKRLGRPAHEGLLLGTVHILLSISMGQFYTASRVPPAAMIMLGLLAWPNPYASALFLGLASATMWYPIILFPLWLGTFRRRDRLKFLAVYVVLGIAFFVMLIRGPGTLAERLQVFSEHLLFRQGALPDNVLLGGDTAYFWSVFGPRSLAAGLIRNGLSFAHLGLCVAAFWWPRRKTRFRLIAMSAALVAGTQLWRTAHGGEYVGWYLPFALVTLFGTAGQDEEQPLGDAPVQA